MNRWFQGNELMPSQEEYLDCIDSMFEVASAFRSASRGTIVAAANADKHAFKLAIGGQFAVVAGLPGIWILYRRRRVRRKSCC